MKKILLSSALAIFILAITATCISASSNISYGGAVSPALFVISRDMPMIKTGFCGRDIAFSEDDFTDLIGNGRLDAVTVLSLPKASAGKLMLGALEVVEGQMISASNLSFLRFVPSSASEECECSFEFRTGKDQEYDMLCSIFVTDKLNFAPTVADAQEDEFYLQTYKNIAYFGNLPASDPEGDGMRFEISDYPKRGLVSITDRENGEFVYTPTKNYSGKDFFSYTVRDKYGNSSGDIRVSIEVIASDEGAVFTDLIGKECHNAAIALYDKGIISGKREGSGLVLLPDEKISGAELICGAMKALGIELVEDGGEDSSVSGGESIPEEYRRYLATAEEKGYLAHYREGSGFDPDGSITLAQACVLISRMMSPAVPSDRPVFEDGELIPAWASDALYSLEAIGVIEDENGYISPEKELSRSDCIMMLAELCG